MDALETTSTKPIDRSFSINAGRCCMWTTICWRFINHRDCWCKGTAPATSALLDLAKQWIKERYDKPGKVFLAMVHRLDRPVAGVVLFARTSKAAGRLARQFRERSVDKRYLAGSARCRRPRIATANRSHRTAGPTSRVVPAPTANSQEARLHYMRLDTAGDKSLLEITLETGRRHQIRIQLSRMGHPILGDLRYGADKPLPEKTDRPVGPQPVR